MKIKNISKDYFTKKKKLQLSIMSPIHLIKENFMLLLDTLDLENPLY